MKYTITLNQDELNALTACVDYLLDSEQQHYEESLEDEEGSNPNHIYYNALALSHVKHLKWTNN